MSLPRDPVIILQGINLREVNDYVLKIHRNAQSCFGNNTSIPLTGIIFLRMSKLLMCSQSRVNNSKVVLDTVNQAFH